ncbi:MAG TPA: dethiobiotin synthase [Xanthomonadaceae bacterium]|nr:dethiobiotin synthase [Xanthomonadaceae bacterium]
MSRCWFVTGTDTGIGKTHACVALLGALRAAGCRAMGMKPVASGCEPVDGAWLNDDAQRLIGASAVAAPYALVNPYAFPEPVSPHIAAARSGQSIDLARVIEAARALLEMGELLVVEGAGGWLSPVAKDLWQADIARALQAPVILVVGLRLGCINHALLSARAIEGDGCRLAGWIGNHIDPRLDASDEVIDTLAGSLRAPCIGVLPWGVEDASGALNLAKLQY